MKHSRKYYGITDNSKFVCRRQGCNWFHEYEEGKDYGIYIKNNSDCSACQEKCEKDDKCGAVWCGSEKSTIYSFKHAGDCLWWRTGKCLDDYEVYTGDGYHLYEGYTCYKGTNGLSNTKYICYIFSLKKSGKKSRI